MSTCIGFNLYLVFEHLMKRKGEKTVGQFVNKMKIFLKNVVLLLSNSLDLIKAVNFKYI